MGELSQMACKTEVSPLSMEQSRIFLNEINQWNLIEDKQQISREFRFKNYYETMAFVNAVAWISHRQNHHPNMEISYNRCVVRYTTHSVSGLSDNDFICAAKVNLLFNGE